MPLSLHVPRRFHPGYSLLGRWMRQVIDDERQAESFFIIALFGLGLGLLLAQYLAWAFLQPTLTADPTGSTSMTFWGLQLGAFALYLLTCMVGFKPSIHVTATAARLHIRQGQRTSSVSFAEIDTIGSISALRFHRHYRRYTATQVFVNRIERELLLLRTAQGPIVLGLPDEQRTTLVDHLDAHRTPAVSLSAARVA